ncbi:MAG TPA: tetratricopeptide repeat protein, partial [Kofleriaceae bacterium]|nr:tetratricopeptide repeat protein [Kofleriaceae bacterium]
MRNTLFVAIAAVIGLSGLADAKEPPGKIPLTTTSDEARDLYHKAQDLADKLKGTDAHKVFEQAVAKDANFAMAYLGLAQSAGTTKEFFDALQHAVNAAPKASPGEQLVIKSVEAGAKNDPSHQKEYLTKLVQQFPNDERAQLQLGIYYTGTQDYPASIKALEAAIKLNPQFSAPYNQVGYAYRFVDRFQDAEKAFKKYVELIPDDPNPYDSYAELLMKMGRFDESIKNYDKALSLEPNFVSSLIGIGNCQMFLGKFDDARKTFTKQISIARTDGERRGAQIWMVVSYTHEGAWDKALAEVDKLTAISTKTNDNGQIAFDLNFAGNILLEAGRFDDAAKKFKAQVEMTDKAEVPAENKEAAHRNTLYDE